MIIRSFLYVVNKEKLTPIKEISGQYTIYNYFPFDEKRNFEIYSVVIQPNGIYQSGSHGEKSSEYILVTNGTLTLKVEDEFYEIEKGSAIRFDSNKEHRYINNGKNPLEFVIHFVISS